MSDDALWTLLAAAVVALAPVPCVAQQVSTPVVPGCISFMPEYVPHSDHDISRANGAEILCFRGAAANAVLDELRGREKVQVARMRREHAECGDLNPTLVCRQRIARELPFPAPTPDMAALMQRRGLSWGQ